MKIRVVLEYECEGGEAECLSILRDCYRPRNGRVESFSSGHREDGAFISDRGRCVSEAIEVVER